MLSLLCAGTALLSLRAAEASLHARSSDGRTLSALLIAGTVLAAPCSILPEAEALLDAPDATLLCALLCALLSAETALRKQDAPAEHHCGTQSDLNWFHGTDSHRTVDLSSRQYNILSLNASCVLRSG